MNNSCIVRAHGAGLFSNINKVLVCLRIYDHVHVDWSKAAPNDPAFKYGGSFYGDCWNDLFEPTTPPLGLGFDIISQYPFYDITGACAGVLYQNPEWGWRERYHEAWKKLTCKIKPMDISPNTLGVMIRSDLHRGEQITDRSQPLEEYASVINKIGAEKIFVVSSDEESVDWMMRRYNNAMSTVGIKRSATRSSPEQHITVPQTKEDAMAVMKEILTLSQCRALIHPVSNMSTAALYMNPSLRSIYLK